jgi:hypothetical protein
MKDMVDRWAEFEKGERPKQFVTREEMLDSVETWTQGSFIPATERERARWSPEEQAEHDRREKFLLRTGVRENALAQFTFPEDAAWVARALRERKKFAREIVDLHRHLKNVTGASREEAHEIVQRYYEAYPMLKKMVEQDLKEDEFMQATLAQAERYGEINKSDMERFLAIVRKHYPRPIRAVMEEFQARSRVFRPGQAREATNFFVQSEHAAEAINKGKKK